MAIVTAAVIIIGNEVLSGRTRDDNIQFLAQGLGALGVRLAEVRVVRDEEAAIIEAVNACRNVYDYLFTTGGIGPTHDDITAAAIAKAFGVPLVRDPAAVALLERHYTKERLNAARLKMAHVPDGAALIANPVSQAPGFRMGNVYVLAGVPSIMRAMFEGIAHELTGGPPLLSRTVSTHLTEGEIAAGLAAVQNRFPNVEIGSYPFFRHEKLGVSLVLRATAEETLLAATDEIVALLRSLGTEPVDQVS